MEINVKRESNISAWQLRLFEGLDTDVMVMQRNEEEVFDDALHVFMNREYYDAYVAKAVKYGDYRYAYHNDKLGEVLYQLFDENTEGLSLHMNTDNKAQGSVLCDEKYISADDLVMMRDVVDSYHFLYTRAIDRLDMEDAIAHMWTKYVYIIGQLPDARTKPEPGKKLSFELMTMKRKKDGSNATAQDYDYESLKVFLTPDSAMRFNPDKKPVSKYRLSLLSQLVKGRLHVIIEPHRNYWLEFDPAEFDISKHIEIPSYTEDIVKERINGFFDMDRVYTLLAPQRCDYRISSGIPFVLKTDEKNIALFLFEKYEDARDYVLQNPALLPVFDNTFPIGVIDNKDKASGLEMITALAEKAGITVINLDFDTIRAISCKLEFFKNASNREFNLEALTSEITKEQKDAVCRETEDGIQYRMPFLPFYDRKNSYNVSAQRREEVISHIDADFDNGLSYLAGCMLPEMIYFMRELAQRFETARTNEDEEQKSKYNRLMNLATLPITEALCEKPYVYSLREKDGSFTLKNNLAYIIITNRFEALRNGEGRLMPSGVDNPEFMKKLQEAANVAALTDGPNALCLMDTRIMLEAAKQWKKSEPIREEMMIYLTQGCSMTHERARYCYKRLKSDNDIFVEFVSTVRNGEFPPMGMITVQGHNAKEIAEGFGFGIAEAYDALLSLKADSNYLNNLGNGGKETAEEDKKGILGRLFKK